MDNAAGVEARARSLAQMMDVLLAPVLDRAQGQLDTQGSDMWASLTAAELKRARARLPAPQCAHMPRRRRRPDRDGGPPAGTGGGKRG